MSISSQERHALVEQGEQLFAECIAPKLGPEADGQFVVIDVPSGDFEIDAEDLIATKRLLAKHADGRFFYGLRVGYPAAYSFGRINK